VEAVHAGVVQLGVGHSLCHLLPAGEVGDGGVAVHGGVVELIPVLPQTAPESRGGTISNANGSGG